MHLPSSAGRRLGFLGLAGLLVACATEAPPPTSVPRASARTSVPSAAAGPPVGLADLRGTIAYSTEVDGDQDVFVLRLDGSEPVRVTDHLAREFDPAISPDGSRVFYRMNPDPARDDADIWIVDVDGSDRRNLTHAPQWSNWAPIWTPDGTRIAFTSTRGGTLELWTMLPDGTDVRRVAAGWCEYAAPSPDGSAFVCAAAAGGTYDLVIVDVETGERRVLTATPPTEFGPSWSPDGQWIVFSRDLGDRWALLRIRPDGSDEQEIAAEGVFSTWDPDGHLAWVGPGGINVAHPDGSGLVVLAQPADFLSWAP
jgi:Tol biopolymer transport system component